MKKLPKFFQERMLAYHQIHDIERLIFANKQTLDDVIRLSNLAKQGYPLAMIDYAMCLMSGIEIPIDEETAIRYLYQARESASGYEYYLIGIYLMHFSMIDHYYKEAVSCLQRSVEMGFIDALDVLKMFNL